MQSASEQRHAAALVLGLGESGEAAARLLAHLGSRVTIVDQAGGEPLAARRRALEPAGIRVVLGATAAPAAPFDLCVVSPGIPESSAWVRDVERRGIPVWSELELAWRHCAARVLAVTGSNGKSTLVALCRDALEQAGATALLAGNCGPPFSAVVREGVCPAWVVLEVSTFQLERVHEFRPDVGVLLNVFPNHLDRHGNLAVYTALKARLFARMPPAAPAVIGEDVPPEVRNSRPSARWRTFGSGAGVDYRYEPGRVRCAASGREVPLAGTIFDNPVLGQTAAAAVAALEGCGLDPAHVAAAARGFRRLPHRMEDAGMVGGVRFVDDSKGTNLAALAAALRVIDGPIRLIAGGLLKEMDLGAPKKMLFKKAAGVYIIGACSEAMFAAWKGVVPCVICQDLKQAVLRAWKEASPGETILLSPGCASFDQFRGFEDRGDQFCSIVRSLVEGEKT